MRVLCNEHDCIHNYRGRVRMPGDARMQWGVGMCKKDVLDLTFQAMPGFPSCTELHEQDTDEELEIDCFEIECSQCPREPDCSSCMKETYGAYGGSDKDEANS